MPFTKLNPIDNQVSSRDFIAGITGTERPNLARSAINTSIVRWTLQQGTGDGGNMSNFPQMALIILTIRIFPLMKFVKNLVLSQRLKTYLLLAFGTRMESVASREITETRVINRHWKVNLHN